MKSRKIYQRIWDYMRPYKGQFAAAMLATVVMVFSSVIEPIVLGLAITELSRNVVDMLQGVPGAGINYGYIGRVMLLYFIRGMFYHSSNYFGQFWLTNVVQNAIYDLRNDIAEKINRLPVEYFDSQQTGDILAKMTNDVDTVSNALQQSFIQVVNAILTISFVVVSMLLLHWGLALIVILMLPTCYVLGRVIVQKSQPAFNAQSNALGRLFGYAQEQLSGFTEIKVYNQQAKSVEEFKERNRQLRDYGFRASFLSSLMMPTMNLVSNSMYVIVAVVGAFQVLAGRLTVGNLQAFVQYVLQINNPIQIVTQLSTVLQSAMSASQRIFTLLDSPEEEQGPVTQSLDGPVRGAVSFKNVRFGYNPDKPLMKDISFEVQPGQTVAVVGPTGAGKTTLINLLMRFYDIQSGSIEIDGINIQSITREDLRAHFGMVLQDAWLYTDTIRNNIRFGNLLAEDYEVQEAAEIANVHHFIKTLPKGYDMEINEEANNISLGQKQLMTIARAIISDPDILILDEATSSVDTRLEQLIQDAMDKVMEGRTSFVIAHRLSTIRDADMILVMQNGNIVEQGNHDSLLAEGGLYADLYNSQFNTGTPADIHMEF